MPKLSEEPGTPRRTCFSQARRAGDPSRKEGVTQRTVGTRLSWRHLSIVLTLMCSSDATTLLLPAEPLFPGSSPGTHLSLATAHALNFPLWHQAWLSQACLPALLPLDTADVTDTDSLLSDPSWLLAWVNVKTEYYAHIHNICRFYRVPQLVTHFTLTWRSWHF